MAGRIVLAGALAVASVASQAQEVVKGDIPTASSPSMHQCTLAAVDGFAINTKGTGANSGRASADAEQLTPRIELQLRAPTGAESAPMISAHAINTKGTGATTGRMSSKHAINTKGTGVTSGRSEHAINTKGTSVNTGRMSGKHATHGKGTGTSPGHDGNYGDPIAVSCAEVDIAADATARAAAGQLPSVSAGGSNLRWSCSVSGTEERPVFRVNVLMARPAANSAPQGQAEGWSWGASNSNSRVSIVPRVSPKRGDGRAACLSATPRSDEYELVVEAVERG